MRKTGSAITLSDYLGSSIIAIMLRDLLDLIGYYIVGIVGMTISTGVILAVCFIIADYINAKMKVKELQARLDECQRELYDAEHPAAAGRLREKNGASPCSGSNGCGDSP